MGLDFEKYFFCWNSILGFALIHRVCFLVGVMDMDFTTTNGAIIGEEVEVIGIDVPTVR